MRSTPHIRKPNSRHGMAYVAVLFLLVIIFTMGMAFLLRIGADSTAVMTRGGTMQAHYLAESAVNHAMWRLINEDTFPVNDSAYYMHSLAGGRYGYKVRRHTDTTFATVAAIGALGESVVHQRYVLYILPPFVDPNTCVPEGLIAHYTLDEGTGLVANDATGLGPQATLQNDPSGSGWTTGQVDGAYDFDGVSAYFKTSANSSDLQIANEYSIAIWMNAASTQKTWAGLVSKNSPAGDQNHWTLQFDDSSGSAKRVTVYHPSGNWRTTYTLANAMNAWHHLAVTYRRSPARVQLFVDGVLHSESTSLTQGPGSGNGKLHIGADRTGTSNYVFAGNLDDVRIYDRVLTPEEVDIIFQGNCAQTQRLYWTDIGDDVIGRSDLEGANPENIVPKLDDATDIEIDLAGKKVYWAERRSNLIQRADLDGANVENLFPKADIPIDIELDTANGKIYWAESGGRIIRRANLDGSNLEDVMAKIDLITDIELDPRGGRIYWADQGAKHIASADFDGENVLILTSNVTDPVDLEIDVNGGKIYWADAGNNTISRANLNGSGVQIVAGKVGLPTDIEIDSAGNKIYWTDQSTSEIRRANRNGTDAETIIANVNAPVDLELEPVIQKIYWIDSREKHIKRADFDGANVEDIVTGLSDPRKIKIAILNTPVGTREPEVVFQNFAEAKQSSDVQSITVNTPRGTVQDDLLIAAIAVDTHESIAAPSGWTPIATARHRQVTLGIWWKIAGASESPAHTFTWGSNEQAYGWMMRFTGHDIADPINASATTSGAGPSTTSPSVTSTVDNAMILRIGAFDGSDINLDVTGLNGASDITMDASGSGGGSVSGGAGYVIQAAAGPSGADLFDINSNEQYVTATLAIAPDTN